MRRLSWAARLPALYDVVMSPLEIAAVARWRAALWASVPRDGRGLEVGAGSGASGAHLEARPGVVCLDLSPSALTRARARGRLSQASAAAAGDVQRLPFRDGAFDWVVGSLVFCEVTDPLAGLRELRRVLRPGGTLHLLEHVRPRGRLSAAAARAVTRVTGPLFGEHFDRATRDTVRAAGFALERTDWRLGGAVVHVIGRR